MLIDTVRDQLKQLRMPVASAELETIIQKRKKNTDVQWVSELLSAELDARKDNAVEKESEKQDSRREEAWNNLIGNLIKNFLGKKLKSCHGSTLFMPTR